MVNIQNMIVKSQNNDSISNLNTEHKDFSSIEEEISLYFELIEKEKYSLLTEDAFLAIFNMFFGNNYSYNDCFCSAINNYMLIDVHGNIWPCQFFINNNDFYLGNIKQKYDNKGSASFQSVINKFHFSSKNKVKKCKTCIAKFSCVVCLGIIPNNLLEQGDILQIIEKQIKCEYRQDTTELLLEHIASYIKKGRFEYFNKKIIKFI